MRRSILHRRKRKRVNQVFDLQLTSMMDILVIIVVFMLKSYSATVPFNTSSSITLPRSSAQEIPVDSLSVIIEPTGIILDSNKIVEFEAPYEIEKRYLADSGRRILPLYDALMKAKEKAELLMSKAVWKDEQNQTVAPKFRGTLVVQADKEIRYELLRKILYTAGAAEFKIFKLAMIRKDGSF